MGVRILGPLIENCLGPWIFFSKDTLSYKRQSSPASKCFTWWYHRSPLDSDILTPPPTRWPHNAVLFDNNDGNNNISCNSMKSSLKTGSKKKWLMEYWVFISCYCSLFVHHLSFLFSCLSPLHLFLLFISSSLQLVWQMGGSQKRSGGLMNGRFSVKTDRMLH